MLKALIKKQFMQMLNPSGSTGKSRKPGKKRSPIGVIAVILYCVGVFGFLFFQMAINMCEPLVSTGKGWLYFAILGTMAAALGVIGSIFTTYSALYVAKDNELLLSMPIPPMYILLVRMIACFASTLLFEALVFVPGIVAYAVSGYATVGRVILQVIGLILLSLFSLALSCALGWVVAQIVSRLPKTSKKSFITVIVSLAFLAVYYYYYAKFMRYINVIASYADNMIPAFRGVLYPMMLFGSGADGNAVNMLCFAAGVLVLFAAVSYLLARSFIRLITTERGEAKAKYTRKLVKRGSIGSALLKKEAMRLTSSSTYMLNCSLGSMMCVIGAVFAVIKMKDLRMIGDQLAGLAGKGTVPLLICAVLCMIATMNDISAPSISMEGKSLWIVQSVPVDTWEVLRAKIKLHMLVSAIPVGLLTVIVLMILGQDVLDSLLVIAAIILFIWLYGLIGLALNLKKPKLEWDNEAYAVKQDIMIFLIMISGWATVAVMTFVGFILSTRLGAPVILLIASVVFAAGALLIRKWLRNKGTERLRYLA